jgi:hypothetical protein
MGKTYPSNSEVPTIVVKLFMLEASTYGRKILF